MITVIIRYSGTDGNAKKFFKEMQSLKIVDEIRNEDGNIRYEYFYPIDDDESIILIDSWINQEALNRHHLSPVMNKISQLRDKYNLHMKVEKYQLVTDNIDEKYIRK